MFSNKEYVIIAYGQINLLIRGTFIKNTAVLSSLNIHPKYNKMK